jgi:hypothetical protein
LEQLFHGDGPDLFIGDQAGEHFQNSILNECHHSFLHSQALHLRGFRAVLDQTSQFIRSAEEFVQGDPTFEACLFAGLTATSSIELEVFAMPQSEHVPRVLTVPMYESIELLRRWMVRLFTIDADPLAKALCEHPLHGIGEVERVAS